MIKKDTELPGLLLFVMLPEGSQTYGKRLTPDYHTVSLCEGGCMIYCWAAWGKWAHAYCPICGISWMEKGFKEGGLGSAAECRNQPHLSLSAQGLQMSNELDIKDVLPDVCTCPTHESGFALHRG